MMAMQDQLPVLPKITFGLIVLNGEPFLRQNLRALYPFAHQIIVVEGAGPNASHIATPHGHSLDDTLAVVRCFQAEEDPEGKLLLVTAEDDGHPNGFWPGEKDQQSQAYARRATGEWLWQVDVDEFYHPAAMQRVCALLARSPELTCLTFNAYHFWGGFGYLVEGGLYQSRAFQGELWGAYRRLFRWSAGSRYVSHRPPTVHDGSGRDITSLRKLSASRVLPGVLMYHYTNVFPSQVLPKGVYYASLGQVDQRSKFESFMQPLTWRRALRIYTHYGTFNWLRAFTGSHPPAIEMLRQELASGEWRLSIRATDDIEQLLAMPAYKLAVGALRCLEALRTRYQNARHVAHRLGVPILRSLVPPGLRWALPRAWQLKLARQPEPKL